MEEQKPFESYIRRMTPEFPITFSADGERHRVALRYDNTIIFTHSEDYEHFDHIFIYGEDYGPQGIAIFRDEDGTFDLAETLIEMGYDIYHKKFPSLDDEERWFHYQSSDLDKLLEQ